MPIYIATVKQGRKCHRCDRKIPKDALFVQNVVGTYKRNICVTCMLVITIHMLKGNAHVDINDNTIDLDDNITDEDMQKFKEIFMEVSIGN